VPFPAGDGRRAVNAPAACGPVGTRWGRARTPSSQGEQCDSDHTPIHPGPADRDSGAIESRLQERPLEGPPVGAFDRWAVWRVAAGAAAGGEESWGGTSTDDNAARHFPDTASRRHLPADPPTGVSQDRRVLDRGRGSLLIGGGALSGSSRASVHGVATVPGAPGALLFSSGRYGVVHASVSDSAQRAGNRYPQGSSAGRRTERP
jgi:hypothetical protein